MSPVFGRLHHPGVIGRGCVHVPCSFPFHYSNRCAVFACLQIPKRLGFRRQTSSRRALRRHTTPLPPPSVPSSPPSRAAALRSQSLVVRQRRLSRASARALPYLPSTFPPPAKTCSGKNDSASLPAPTATL